MSRTKIPCRPRKTARRGDQICAVTADARSVEHSLYAEYPIVRLIVATDLSATDSAGSGCASEVAKGTRNALSDPAAANVDVAADVATGPIVNGRSYNGGCLGVGPRRKVGGRGGRGKYSRGSHTKQNPFHVLFLAADRNLW